MITLRRAIEDKLNAYQREIDNITFSQDPLKTKESKLRSLIYHRNRWRCRNDLFYLCEVTGHDKIVSIPRHYQPFCDEVSLMNWKIVQENIQPPSKYMLDIDEVTDSPKKDLVFERLYLCFRTYWKTSIISKVHTLQLLLNFPNIHIILCHNKQENASSILVSIKNMFLTTGIKTLFPECIPNTKEWGNMSQFSLANRTDWSREEHNLTAAGVDTEITGGHWQVAKKNDLVTEKSVGTEEQIKKSVAWNERFDIGHFDNPEQPIQDYEGTRYHFADMYSQLKTNSRIRLVQIPLLTDPNDNSSCPLPERFTPEGIQALREDDPWVFWTQMLLEPKDPAKMRFSPQMIHYYPSLPKGMNFYLLIDPASARKKKNDFTVMLIVALDSEEKRYIADGLRDKLDPKQRVDEAVRLSLRWNVKEIGWEALGFQSTDCFYFEEKRRSTKLSITPQEIKSHSSSKIDRIRGLTPEYASGQWFWPPKDSIVNTSKFDGRNYDLTEEIEYEFLHFPLGQHDDLLDTMTFLNLMNTSIPRPYKDPEKPKGMTYGEYAKISDGKKRFSMLGVFARMGY